jgi:phosphoribosylglycinamide formyltransferase-1
MKRIALFASGTGSNVLNLIQYFKSSPDVQVALLVTNNVSCGAAGHAKANQIEVLGLDNEQVKDGAYIANALKQRKIDFIVLAGYLKMIPEALVNAFPNSIINVHPSLLPKFGGHGMYGKHVHKAVYEAKEKETGITIHYVNNEYDKGEIIERYSVALSDFETVESIEAKVRELEMKWLPFVTEKTVLKP